MTHFPTNQIPLVLQTLIKSPVNFCGTSSGFQSKVESFSLKHIIYYPPFFTESYAAVYSYESFDNLYSHILSF